MADARRTVAALVPAAVITGGSRGLGLALAYQFARHDRTVVLVARSETELTSACALIARDTRQRAVALALDLAEPQAGLRLERALSSLGIYVDVLVNNAGCGVAGRFDEAPAEEVDRLLQLNVVVLTALCRQFLGPMRARRSGGILNVASLGGVVPGPGQAAYYASKAFVLSLTEALHGECKGEGVRISALAPGPLETRFHADMGADNDLYRYVIPTVSLQRTARIAHRGWTMGQTVIVPGFINRALFALLRLLPHPLSVPIVQILLRRIG